MDEYKYDVALSFASEQREYVEQVANQLNRLGIKCFYDNNYKTKLWGENLLKYLEDVYCRKSQYCIIFISEAYNKKQWTKFEYDVIMERFYLNDHTGDSSQYLLPVRFDDTELSGLRNSLGIISAQETTPKELAHMIYDKLYENKNNVQTAQSELDLNVIYDELKKHLSYNFIDNHIRVSSLQEKIDAILFFSEVSNDFMQYSGKIFKNNNHKLFLINLGFFDNPHFVAEMTPSQLISQLLNIEYSFVQRGNL